MTFILSIKITSYKSNVNFFKLLLFLKQTHSDNPERWSCCNSQIQEVYIPNEGVAHSVITLNLTSVIDAHDNYNVSILDIVGHS